MEVNPFDLPPGPERRDLLTARGFNISDLDYTADELEAASARAAELLQRLDEPGWGRPYAAPSAS